MQYKGLEITAFEETPGKWRARIVRANGDHRKLAKTLASTNQTLAGTNRPSAVDALTLALEAIDAAGLFFRNVDRERSAYPLASGGPFQKYAAFLRGGIENRARWDFWPRGGRS